MAYLPINNSTQPVTVIASEAWQSHAGDTAAIRDCHASLAMTKIIIPDNKKIDLQICHLDEGEILSTLTLRSLLRRDDTFLFF